VRPDNAFLAEQQRLLVGWPTKLALAPDFADRVLSQPGARRHPPGASRPGRPATPATGRTGLGATAAMSLPTLHDLHRPLGSTGLLVSPLGLGTVKLGRDQGVKYPNGFTIPGDDEARLLLAQARELGINLIDTAPAYGRSEERLGPLLRGQRDEWVIVSKVGEEFDDGQSRFDFSAAHTRRSVERSLRAWKPTASNWCWCIPTATTWRSSNRRGLPDPCRTQAGGQDSRLRFLRQNRRRRPEGPGARRLRHGHLQPQRAGRTPGAGLRCRTRQGHPGEERPWPAGMSAWPRGRPGAGQLRAAVRPPGRQQCYCRHHQPLHLAHNVATVARILGQH
jgi:hypothetical protein